MIIIALLHVAAGSAWGEDSLCFANLGDFTLENGEVISDCRVAYRVIGSLNAQKSNGVLMPTWLAGTTQEFLDLGLVGPGKMIDSTRFCVIAVDAFGNGVSSSPSNSRSQPGKAFPEFSIRDMVRAQHILLTRELGIPRLAAVVGFSMGGMQAFQWVVSYPDFAQKAVPIVGAPWLSSNDLLSWQAELGVISALQGCQTGNEAIMRAITPVHSMLVWTPRFRAVNTSAADFPAFLDATEKAMLKYDANDWAWQLKAVMRHDIRAGFGGSAEKAAAAVHAKVLVITAPQDRAVYPDTARSFAGLLNAPAYELTGDCGHLAFLCEQEKLKDLVGGFLEKKP